MLSYQHSYHAGMFADVVKHMALLELLDYLTQKDKPLFYLETHAGRGLYDLQSKESKKTGEASRGIEIVWNERANLPPICLPFIQLLQSLNPTDELSHYPGSPYVALHALRPEDRLYCCERHPKEFSHLETLDHQGKRVFFSHSDGFEQLEALLPPPEKRGLIFIDPSYEIKKEYTQIPKLIKEALRRFATGVYVIWYPLLADRHGSDQLTQGLRNLDCKSLQVEFHLNQQGLEGIQGCGLWIINPPYVFADKFKSILKVLARSFNPNYSTYFVRSFESPNTQHRSM